MSSTTNSTTLPSNLMSSNSYSSVTKLTSTTFHNWKLRLETLLGAWKLRRFINEDTIPPTDPTSLDAHTTSDCQALNAIFSTIDDENFQVVSSCRTAREAFVALCKHHGDSGGISTATLFFELVNLRVTGDITIKDHVHNFQTLHNKLKSNIKENSELMISDHFIAILLLFSLPAEFTPLVQTTLTTTAFDKIDVNHLYMLILVSDRVDSSSSITPSANSAMIASTKSRHKPRPEKSHAQSNNPPKCSLGHIGHTDAQCRIQKSDAKDKQIADLVARLDKLEKPSLESAKLVTDNYYDEAFITSATSLHLITLDAGATTHMFGDTNLLQHIEQVLPSPINVAAKDQSIFADARGSIRLGGLKITHVMASKDLAANLISAGKLYDAGHDIEWGRTYANVKDQNGKTLVTFQRDPSGNRLWQLQVSPRSDSAYFVKNKRQMADLWHQRLGHLHPLAVIRFLQSIDINNISMDDYSRCIDCRMGKSIKSPRTHSFHRSPSILNCIHSDLVGPIAPASLGGKKYMMTFIDDFTWYNSVYFLATKDEAFKAFQHYKLWIEARTHAKVLKLKSDRGGEYSSTKFLTFLKDCAIDIERGPAERPTSNGVSERFNRTLLSKMRAQLYQSGLPLHFWAELVLYTSLQINCSPTIALQHQIPLNVFSKQLDSHEHPFNFKRLKTFGCLAYVHTKTRTKLGPTAKRMIFVGLEPGSNAYRL